MSFETRGRDTGIQLIIIKRGKNEIINLIIFVVERMNKNE